MRKLLVSLVAAASVIVMPIVADAKINKVVAGHVGSGHSAAGGNANYLFPLQTGLNKVTIQGNAAMSTAKAVSLGPLKANVKIVGKGTNYLHLNITVSREAPDGQTGDGIIIQPVKKGVPDKFRWKVYKRGKVTAIDGPNIVDLGSSHTVVFRGSDMGRARMISQSSKWSSATRTGRSQGAVTYRITFDQCSGGKVSIKPFILVNEDLPPAFRNSVAISGFRGNASKTVTINDVQCQPARIRGGAVAGGCPPGYHRPNPKGGCVRR